MTHAKASLLMPLGVGAKAGVLAALAPAHAAALLVELRLRGDFAPVADAMAQGARAAVKDELRNCKVPLSQPA